MEDRIRRKLKRPDLMNHPSIIRVLFSLLLLPLCGHSQSVMTWMVGTHQEVITPRDSAYIAGHTYNRRFTGVHDDLFVKAIAIASKTDTLVILTFDCIGLLYPQLEEIRNRIAGLRPSFPTHQIAMTSTHTHSGPDVVGLWGKDAFHSGVDKEYMQHLLSLAVKSVQEALNTVVPARAIYAIEEFGDEWVFNISQPDELDRSLTILQFKDQYGQNLATLTNFACHPTFLDGVNDRVSSDYVGGYYRGLDREQGGLNFFLQGAIGGWIQPEYEEKSHEQAFFRGEELAARVLRALQNATSLPGSEIHFDSRIFNMPVVNDGFKQLSKMGVIDRAIGDSVKTEVAFFKIGEAAFATHPGETVPALALATKEMMQNAGPRFIIGLGMDALGYILKPEFFDASRRIPHSSYLCSVSVGPDTQAYILRSLMSMIVNSWEE